VGPRTHYQASFTARQALALFLGLLFALGISYFLGLMTGLTGSEPRETGAAPSQTPGIVAGGPPPVPAAAVVGGAGDDLVFPLPVTAAPDADAAAQPTAPATIQVFQDGEGAAPAAAREHAAPPASASGGFRVQVLSVSSRKEADSEAARLSRRGYPALVEPGTGPRGPVYRVRVGPFAQREEALRTAERLSREEKRETWIVPPGP